MHDEDRLLISDSLEGQIDFESDEAEQESEAGQTVYLTLISESGNDALSTALTSMKVGKKKMTFKSIARIVDVLSFITSGVPRFSVGKIEVNGSSTDVDVSGYELLSVSYVERRQEPTLCDSTFVFRKILKV